MKKIFFFLLKRVVLILFLLALPFLVLVKTSVYLYLAKNLGAYECLLLSALLSSSVVAILASIFSKKITGKFHLWWMASRVATPLVLFYSLYSLIYFSEVNSKEKEIKMFYTKLHPLLRVALTSVVLIDRDLVVTDIKRSPKDYAKMNLRRLSNSRHFVQKDGYVHAVDIRTVNQSMVNNFLVKVYFNLMGFKTLRHVGTADHLHVSLPLKD